MDASFGDPLRLDARIGIVGAGAAGLSSAHALARAGFGNVTVLEREGRVGGKCCTFHHRGLSYELGAAVLTTAYTNVHELMVETGTQCVRQFSGRSGDVVPTSAFSRMCGSRCDRWRGMPWEFARMTVEVVRHRTLREPGLRQVPGDLATPFARWATEHRFEHAAQLVEPWFTAWGYGYLNEMPAAYVLKYMNLSGVMSEILDGGYQGLWERVARSLDVRRGVEIQRVRRDVRGVNVESKHEAWVFDRLVLACPLDHALSFIDASADETALFRRVVWNDYRVVVASVNGLNDARYLFFPQNFGADTQGRPMFAYKRWPGSDVRLFYCFAQEGMSPEQSVNEVEVAVRRCGGRVTNVHHVKCWRYFPHVKPGDIRDGFYDHVEALQGCRRTYYTGELLAFGTVETVVAHARAMVAKHFGATVR